jgi:hypothetical protein
MGPVHAPLVRDLVRRGTSPPALPRPGIRTVGGPDAAARDVLADQVDVPGQRRRTGAWAGASSACAGTPEAIKPAQKITTAGNVRIICCACELPLVGDAQVVALRQDASSGAALGWCWVAVKTAL